MRLRARRARFAIPRPALPSRPFCVPTIANKRICSGLTAFVVIIPKAPRACLAACGDQDVELLGRLQLAAIKIAAQEKLESYRVVVNCGEDAGQTVFHLHMHLLGGRKFAWPAG